jgi:predicted nucleic acid-binding protein
VTRFVVDVGAALHLVRHGVEVAADHELLAPTLLRSQLLSTLHEAVHRGELTADDAETEIAAVRRLRLRLLGDAVLQRVAWKVADQLGWPSTYAAEYIALTQLQADALVTLDEDLARAAATLVTVGDIRDLEGTA